MAGLRKLILALLVLFLPACLTLTITDPNTPSPGAASGIGFGEELFKLQGRVDYLYGHVLRNQQKLELQVGDLQRSIQSLEQGSELSALRSDVLRLRDELSQMRAKMASSSVVSEKNLKEKIDYLYKQMSKTLDARISRLEKSLLRAKSPRETPPLTPEVVGYSEEAEVPGANLDNSNLPIAETGDGRLKAADRLNGREAGTLLRKALTSCVKAVN